MSTQSFRLAHNHWSCTHTIIDFDSTHSLNLGTQSSPIVRTYGHRSSVHFTAFADFGSFNHSCCSWQQWPAELHEIEKSFFCNSGVANPNVKATTVAPTFWVGTKSKNICFQMLEKYKICVRGVNINYNNLSIYCEFTLLASQGLKRFWDFVAVLDWSRWSFSVWAQPIRI